MSHRIAIIQGHPDARDGHLGHALADAYAEGAAFAGHELRRVTVAELDFPMLRRKEDWEEQAAPEAIRQAQEAIMWADHLVIVHPLWLGSMPAIMKAFLEQVFRPGFAIERTAGTWKRLLRGRSAHVIVTMGMPALLYRMYFLSHGVRSLVRNVLGLSGIAPVRTTLIGSVEADKGGRVARWLTRMQRFGVAAY